MGMIRKIGGGLDVASFDVPNAPPLNGMVGEAPTFRAMSAQIRRIALAAAPVLIEGETGVGKELAARAIHYLGERRDRPFVPLNCGAVPDNLIESELFGHVRGAFTDAVRERCGVIRQAAGGTLFLDEVDTLSPKAQVVLLRFLQDRHYRPVGDDRLLASDARIIAASNRPLHHAVASGCFRADLLYRVNILSLRVPPLRERAGDVALLARHCAERFCVQYGLAHKTFEAATLDWLCARDWPGNVRELENCVHRLVLLADGDDVIRHQDVDAVAADGGASPRSFHEAKALAIAQFERRYLAELLAHADGNVSAAARLAQKERRAFGKLLKKHGIGRTSFAH